MVQVLDCFGMYITLIVDNDRALEYLYDGCQSGGRSYQQPQTGEQHDPINLISDDEEDIYDLEGENGTNIDHIQGYTTRYIRARTGAFLTVRLSFDQAFSFLDECDGIQVILLINNRAQSPINIPTLDIKQAFEGPKFASIYEKVISRLPCKSDGKRFYGRMQFANVDVDDEHGQDNALDVGNIRIHCFCMRAEKKSIAPQSASRKARNAAHRASTRFWAGTPSTSSTAGGSASQITSSGSASQANEANPTSTLRTAKPKITRRALQKATKWTKWSGTGEDRKPSRGSQPTHVVEFVAPPQKPPPAPRTPAETPVPQTPTRHANKLASRRPYGSPRGSEESIAGTPRYKTVWHYQGDADGGTPKPFCKVCFEFRSAGEIEARGMQVA